MSETLLRDLDQLVRPEHTALVVIDPQHDFCSENGALAQRFGFDMKSIQEAVPRLNALIEECRARDVAVVWVREVFSDDKMRRNQKALWGSGDDIWLIKEGTHGTDWYEGMVEPLPDEPVVTKWQYGRVRGHRPGTAAPEPQRRHAPDVGLHDERLRGDDGPPRLHQGVPHRPGRGLHGGDDPRRARLGGLQHRDLLRHVDSPRPRSSRSGPANRPRRERRVDSRLDAATATEGPRTRTPLVDVHIHYIPPALLRVIAAGRSRP